MKPEHLVQLSRQAVAMLVAIRPLTGRCSLVFPFSRHAHRPMSENAIGYMLNRAGYHSIHVPHGWRAILGTARRRFGGTGRPTLGKASSGFRSVVQWRLPGDDQRVAAAVFGRRTWRCLSESAKSNRSPDVSK
jgi:hypothetical protein